MNVDNVRQPVYLMAVYNIGGLDMATKAFRVPKKIGECADLLYKTQQSRYVLQKEVTALEDQEKLIKAYLIDTLPKTESSGVAGKMARVTITTKVVPQVTDWDALYKHIKKSGEFELMQRRLSEGAVKERWENDKSVPGVGTFTTVGVGINKL